MITICCCALIFNVMTASQPHYSVWYAQKYIYDIIYYNRLMSLWPGDMDFIAVLSPQLVYCLALTIISVAYPQLNCSNSLRKIVLVYILNIYWQYHSNNWKLGENRWLTCQVLALYPLPKRTNSRKLLFISISCISIICCVHIVKYLYKLMICWKLYNSDEK